MNDCPLVMIEWEDSYRPMPAWIHLSDFEAQTPSKCMSVGWLIYDGEDAKALAPNMGGLDDDNVQACGIMHIPARCIIRTVTLIESENAKVSSSLALSA